MRIIHCADLHLDSRMNANLTKEKARERQAELLGTFQKMMEYAVLHQVDAIIIAGDLYDTKNISAAARNTVREAILRNPGIDFYYLKGNHDAESFLSNLEEMPKNLKLFDSGWTTYTADENHAGRIMITGTELCKENAASVYNELTLDVEKFNIVVLHGQEAEHASRDGAEVISLRSLRNKGIDYLALGHIHSYKTGELDARGRYCYPGCLEGRGFDECGEHGFVLLDIDGEKRSFRQEFIPMAGRQLYALDVDITDCMTTSDIAGRIRAVLAEAALDETSLIKLVLKGSVDVECEKNTELLTKQFEDRYYFLKIDDESRLDVDYGQFALDESLKGEFVRTVMAAEGLGEEERAAIVRYGIQVLAGEEPE